MAFCAFCRFRRLRIRFVLIGKMGVLPNFLRVSRAYPALSKEEFDWAAQ
jgi:hypothetical protein